MSLQNVYEIDVDIKRKAAIRSVTVTQNDAVVFIFRVFDEGRIYNIQDGSTFTMTSTRPDRQAVMTAGEIKGENIVQFELGTTEIAVKGKVETVIQVYDAAGRVSTIPFSFNVLNDPSSDYIPSEDEQTLIQKVLGEGPQILADAQQATDDANTAATIANQASENANDAADNANQESSNLAQLKNEVVEATEDALQATEIANLAEVQRKESESIRQDNEQARINAETVRENAESIRNQQETNRQSTTQEAITAVNEAAQNAQSIADDTGYIEPYNPATAYKKNNVVSHNGSSYMAKQDTKGNLPTNSTYWGLLAQKGLDGEGAVSSVNGVGPDTNGNVTIEIPQPPDLSPYATKQALNTVEGKINNHLDDYMPHDSGLSSFASGVDPNGVYTVVDFRRANDTLHLKSTLSNPDGDGNYQTVTWKFYASNGTSVALTVTWTITYDAEGNIVNKEVA